MKFSSKDYDDIIEILYRNPFIFYKDIAKQIPNCTKLDISTLFSELRKEYINDDAIDSFLANNSTPQDTILFINGALKSLYKDNIDQSKTLGDLFEEIGVFYENEERKSPDIVDPCYSVIYKYLAALMLNNKLPTLSATESAVVLTLMFEVLNFSNEMFARKSEFTGQFCDNIQTKLGQVLVKSILNEDEWNGRNDAALIAAFNIPEVNEEDLKRDPNSVNHKIQKQIAMQSLNPFKVTQEEVKVFKNVTDDLLAEEEKNCRNVDTIFELMGIIDEASTVIAKANNGQQVIVHNRKYEPLQHAVGGSLKRTNQEADLETAICTRFSSHDIIDVAKFKDSRPDNGETSTATKKRKLSDQ